MKKIIIISFVLIFIGNKRLYSQISFLGFDKSQCFKNENIDYTYQNLTCSHTSYFRIYKKGTLVYESASCSTLESNSVDSMIFISESTGFIINSGMEGYSVLKTTDSARTWIPIGGGTRTFLGLFLINANTGYLITTWDSPKAVYIDRISDIEHAFLTTTKDSIKDTIIKDTIFGNPFCKIDTLSFKIKNGIDTLQYKIVLNIKDLPTQVPILNRSFDIFPNPVSDFMNINVTGLNKSETKIEMYNSSGMLIRIFDTLNKTRFYVGDLKTGIYIIELFDNDKRLISKIIKE